MLGIRPKRHPGVCRMVQKYQERMVQRHGTDGSCVLLARKPRPARIPVHTFVSLAE